MKRTLAITAVTAVLALSLAACGAERGDSGMSGMGSAGGTTATDTMRNGDNDQSGTGMTGGGMANSNAAKNELNGVTGALRNGGAGSVNNGGYGAAYRADTADSEDVTPEARYKIMLENARVHDRDGFLLDGENTSRPTF